MKLVRFGAPGAEKPGLIDAQGGVRDLSAHVKYITGDTLSHIAGYCISNDVSERTFQLERAGQWMKGKCCETFGPLGPWLVTRDEIEDVQSLAMSLDVNGERRQTGNTKTMIFGIAHLL